MKISRRNFFLGTGITLAIAPLVAGCASFSMSAEEFNRAINGVKSTYRTYDKAGNVMDDVTGESVRITRDETFDEYVR